MQCKKPKFCCLTSFHSLGYSFLSSVPSNKRRTKYPWVLTKAKKEGDRKTEAKQALSGRNQTWAGEKKKLKRRGSGWLRIGWSSATINLLKMCLHMANAFQVWVAIVRQDIWLEGKDKTCILKPLALGWEWCPQRRQRNMLLYWV